MSETDHESLSEETTDGRRRRSRDSKRRIVAAMLELVREGNIAPTAEEVAQRASVGLRTVFRRFKDMESLYAEMSVAIREMVSPIIDQEPTDTDWRRNFAQLLERRMKVYEIIRPYRVAADALRFQSDVLLNRHRQIVQEERQRLVASLPEFLLTDTTLIDGLEAILSFDMWNQLRDDQKLNADDATRVIYRIVSKLLPEAELQT